MLALIAAIALLSAGAAAGGACLPPGYQHHSKAIALRIEIAQGAKDLTDPVDGTYLAPLHTIGAGQNIASNSKEPVEAFFINGTSNAEGSTVNWAPAGEFSYGLSFTDEKNGVSRANINIGGSEDKHFYIAGAHAPLLLGPKHFMMCDREVEGQQGRHFNVLKGLAEGAKIEENCVEVVLEAYCTTFGADSHVDLTNAYDVRCNPLN